MESWPEVLQYQRVVLLSSMPQ